MNRSEIESRCANARDEATLQFLEPRRSIVGLQPKRADVILAGACIVRTVMEKLDQETLTVSDRGLRLGLLLERFGRLASSPSRISS